jgi:transposase
VTGAAHKGKVVSIYTELSAVEWAFANFKDVIELRPIYHRTDQRVQAHIFVAVLAFLIYRELEKKLKVAGEDLSTTEVVRSVKVIDLTLADSRPKRCVTRANERAARVLRALAAWSSTRLSRPAASKPSCSDNRRSQA